MKDYPLDKSPLPKTFISKPGLYEARYWQGLDQVVGFIVGETTARERREYLFETKFINAKPQTRISLADRKKWSDFTIHKSEDRELKGAPKGHMKDKIAFANRVAEEVRRVFQESQDFLNAKIEEGAKLLCSETFISFTTYLYRDGDWLLTRKVGPRRMHFSAEHLGENASDNIFSERVKNIKQQIEGARQVETERVAHEQAIDEDK